MNLPTLTPADILIAAAVLVIDGLLSVAMRLGVHRPLVVASFRMIVQLVVLGFVLRAVFALDTPWVTALLIVGMTLAAAREAAARSSQRLREGHFLVSLVGIAGPALLVCAFALITMLRPEPIWSARYVIPLMGILLGNILNAVSLGLGSVTEGIAREASAIEARLLLGHPFREAVSALARRSIWRAMIPLINQMSAAGLITMPGIMTGQVMAGIDPLDAATYQIVLMLLLSGGSALAAIVVVRIALSRLTDDRERLRLDRLRPLNQATR